MAVLSAQLDLDLAYTLDHINLPLAGGLDVDLSLGADHVAYQMRAGLGILLEFLPTGLATWAQDESQSYQIIVDFDVDLDTTPAPVPPPTGLTTTIRRVSPTFPAPTLDSKGRPT